VLCRRHGEAYALRWNQRIVERTRYAATAITQAKFETLNGEHVSALKRQGKAEKDHEAVPALAAEVLELVFQSPTVLLGSSPCGDHLAGSSKVGCTPPSCWYLRSACSYC